MDDYVIEIPQAETETFAELVTNLKMQGTKFKAALVGDTYKIVIK